jgi:pimeloyl-ACP methyl ester carboxylesterase
MKRPLTALERFMTADLDAQYGMLADPATRQEVETWMGADAFRQFLEFAPGPANLGPGPKNLVFAPGVMGSTLESRGLGGVWWLDLFRGRDELSKLGLSDNGGRDIDPDADIGPGVVDKTYAPFLRSVANSGSFGGSVQFPYDWRKSLLLSADAMRQRILDTYNEYGENVHLVGHSMGGLLIRTTLMRHGDELWPKIGRIVFIGTPHHGSTAIAGYLKNHFWGWEKLAVLGMFLDRGAFRSMRGVLSLLPAPAGIYPGTTQGGPHPCANFDLYDAGAWCLDMDAEGLANLQDVLDGVRQFWTGLASWHSSLLQEQKDRMLMIAGVGEETLFRLEFSTILWGAWSHTSKITNRQPCEPNREGDGSVPLASAILEDVQMRYVKGVHGGLQNIPEVIRDVLAWLTEQPLALSESCKDALGGHLSSGDGVSLAPLLDGSATGNRFQDLPEYEHPTAAFRDQVANELDAGRIPGINQVKIL